MPKDGELSAALDRLAVQWQRVGAPIVDYLAPPLKRSVVAEALSSVGLAAPSEIVDWFAWHDGLSLPPGVGRHVTECGIEGMQYQSLDDCLIDLQVWRSVNPPVWKPTWFPLLHGWSSDCFVAVLSDGESRCPAGPYHVEFPFTAASDSLLGVVDQVADDIERGALNWIEEGGAGFWRRQAYL